MRSNTLIGFITILFTLKGLGGSFNSVFTQLGIPEFHGPFVGGVIALLMIAFCIRIASEKEPPSNSQGMVERKWLIGLFLLLVLSGTVVRIIKIHQFPIDEGRADMLVAITSQIKDFTHGRDPYQPFTTEGGRTFPRFYLPLLWLSYTPLYLLGIDIRYLNVFVQMVVLLLLLSCFLRKKRYSGFSERASSVLFLTSIALFCFSKQKVADVLDVQTAAFWLFYSLVLWGESIGKHRVTHLCLPLVLVCRHPAILLFLPFFLSLLIQNRRRFWILVAHSLILSSALIFPFMPNPYNVIECILFFGGKFKDAPLEVTSMFYGLSSILQRTHATWLQKPLQISGLCTALWLVFNKKNLMPLQTFALGGVSYITFMVFVSSTPQYVWAEPLLLIYFLLNRPSDGRIDANA